MNEPMGFTIIYQVLLTCTLANTLKILYVLQELLKCREKFGKNKYIQRN